MFQKANMSTIHKLSALAMLAWVLPMSSYALSSDPVSIELIQTTPAYAQIKMSNHSLNNFQINDHFNGNHFEVKVTDKNDLNFPSNCGATLKALSTCTISLHSINNATVGNVDEGEFTVEVLDQTCVVKSVVLHLSNQTDLYAGGVFTYAYNADGSAVNVNHIAKWDGTTWSALGYGIGGQEVNALTVAKDGTLYVGGSFASAGSLAVDSIANWNPVSQQWSALGGGVDGAVNALTTGADGSIYAGGNFANAGGVPAKYIAKWDHTTATWSALGNTVVYTVYSLITGLDGVIYAGSIANGDGTNLFLSWNPVTQVWQSLYPSPSQVRGNINAFTVGLDGTINMGGFLNATTLYLGLFQWNPKTQKWGNSSGMTMFAQSVIDTLATGADGAIYVGGKELYQNSQYNNILKWDGTNWSTLGSGVSDEVKAITTDANGYIYAGGDFTSAGSSAASYIARWTPSTQQWSALAKGFNSYVYTLVMAPSLQIEVLEN